VITAKWFQMKTQVIWSTADILKHWNTWPCL